MHSFKLVAPLLMSVGVAMTSMQAQATDYPQKPITLIIPYTAGGGTDTLGRILATEMGAALGQTIVVENKPGASTTIGAGIVAKSRPDGYTLLLSGSTTHTINPVIFKNLPYDYKTSFEPIGIVAAAPLVLLANPHEIKATTLKELAAQGKQMADLTYASWGMGSITNFIGEMINDRLGLKALNVPYKGSTPAMTDLIGGRVDIAIDTVVASAPQISAGKVKAIAIFDTKRSPSLPDLPTTAEEGYADLTLTPWMAITAPAGLPEDVRSKLVETLATIISKDSMQEALQKAGFALDKGGADEYYRRLDADVRQLQAIASKAHITAN